MKRQEPRWTCAYDKDEDGEYFYLLCHGEQVAEIHTKEDAKEIVKLLNLAELTTLVARKILKGEEPNANTQDSKAKNA